MVPLKLTLYNFLCYRGGPHVLELEPIHIACLCGENGAGKTAILDAITWALWGEARGTDRKGGEAGDHLVYIGEAEMQVELEFLARGQLYRVQRRRQRGRARRPGATILELHIASDGAFHPLSGGNPRETQARIIQLLRMDYATFINTAFLLQGRADEFTSKPPAQRKRILSEVLGLSIYTELEAKARRNRQEAEVKHRSFQMAVQDRERELEGRGHWQAAEARLQGELQALEMPLGAEARRHDGLRRRVDGLLALSQERQRLEAQREEDAAELLEMESRMAALRERLSRFQEVIDGAAVIEEGARRLEEARKAAEEMDSLWKSHNDLSLRRASLERDIERSRAQWEGRRQAILHRIEEMEKAAAALPRLNEELGSVRGELAVLDGDTRLEEDRRRLQELEATVLAKKQENERLQAEGKELEARFKLLAREGDTLHCPLCGTALGPDGVAHLRQEYEAQGKELNRSYTDNLEAVKRLNDEGKTLRAALSKLEDDSRRAREGLHGRQAVLVKGIEEAVGAGERLSEARSELAQVESGLRDATFAPDLVALLQELEGAVASLRYDSSLHEQARARLRELGGFQERMTLLQEARRRMPEDKAEEARIEAMASRRRASVESAVARLASLSQELDGMPALEQALQQSEAALKALTEQQRGLQEELARAKQMQAVLAQREVELQGLSRDMTAARREEELYGELGETFGKDGIQAMLIDAALPELEEEANLLLGKMTDHRMHVKLESQKERRSGKGEAIETLEIAVADDLGTRAYESYSGGEAFRINFALRIALARLLARRSGAPLPTIFIDEGFGTQDASGREKLIEALHAIQDDFDKVLVITHIDELKELFPVRIEVQKGAQGSTFNVVY